MKAVPGVTEPPKHIVVENTDDLFKKGEDNADWEKLGLSSLDEPY